VREAVTADGPRLPAALKAELVRLCRAAVLNALVGAPLDSIVPPADLVRLFVHTVEPPGHRAFDVVDLYDEPRPGELHIPDHREGPAAPEQPAPADPGDRRRGPGSSF
ncbi:hypothetical protein, partial [Actinophytocola sp.]|uniref:hypothetical protein n=1 Tax=Actinophytocola sp. TaxID=1872138 RepID=UPI002ED80111